MKKIEIINRKNIEIHCLIDDEDYKYIKQYHWILRGGNYPARTFYKNNKQYTILMHREIMNAGPKEFIDHINRNTLDNRKQNLRFCNKSKNAMNCKVHKHNTSGYKGVSFLKSINKWRAYIVINNKQIHLGCYLKKEDAALAYNKAAIKYFKEFASLNKLN